MAYCYKCKGNHQIVVEKKEEENPKPRCSNCYQEFLFPEATTEEEFNNLAKEDFEIRMGRWVDAAKSEVERAKKDFKPGLLSTQKKKDLFQEIISEGEEIIELGSASRYTLERYFRIKKGMGGALYPYSSSQEREFYKEKRYKDAREYLRELLSEFVD